MKLNALILCISLLLGVLHLNANEINIDGKIDESNWDYAKNFSNFKTYKPNIGFDASEKTSVFVTNDSLNIYFAIICTDSEPNKIMANLTNRDNLKNDDSFTIEIDLDGNANSNIFFRANPLGIQEDGVVAHNEAEDLNPDKIWFSKGFITETGYQLEIAIPFQTLRFKWKSTVNMKMGFKRKIVRKSEIQVYPEYKPAISNRLLQREILSFSNIEKHKILEVIPSVTYTYNKVLENASWNLKQNKVEAGITGKIGIKSDLVLGLTYNPDFSQIESDAGKIDFNLRNPLFYPEKRPFFQEGIELFDFGAQGLYKIPMTYVVHTRNISNPIYGIKLTGNLGDKYSVASIISSDEGPVNNDHYQIFRLRRKLRKDNFLGLTYTAKENENGYNRLTGIDGNIRINGQSKIEYHFFRSFTKDTLNYKTGNSFGAFYEFKNRIHRLRIGYYQTDKDFDTQVGYLSRKGIQIIPISFFGVIPLKNKLLTKIDYWFNTRQRNDMYNNKHEHWTFIGTQINFKNDSYVWFGKTFATENFQYMRFSTSNIKGGYFFQFNKQLSISGNINWGDRIYYDETNPYQGFGLITNHTLEYSPTSQLKIKLNGNYTNFYRKSDKKYIYDYKIVRLHSTYQLNKKLFVRAIGEYNFYKETLSSELLISFTYIPGTVIQLGYNLQAERNLLGQHLVRNDNLQLNQKSLFFKASYLFN